MTTTKVKFVCCFCDKEFHSISNMHIHKKSCKCNPLLAKDATIQMSNVHREVLRIIESIEQKLHQHSDENNVNVYTTICRVTH